MSSASGLKVGQVWVPKVTSAYSPTFKQVKLVNSHSFGGVTYWWVEADAKSGFTTLESLGASTIKFNFDQKPGFYRVGKTYRFDSGCRDTWLILDLYEIDNPQWHKVKAVARKTTPEGKQDIQTLGQGDFERMVEA